MGRTAPLVLGLILASISFCATATASEADAEAKDRRWVPGFALQTGFLVHERSGEASSLERGSFAGDTKSLFGFGGGSVEIATPRIDIVPARPRLFVRADVLISRDNDEAVVNEADPGYPITRVGPSDDLEGGAVAGVLGVGTSLRVQSEPLVLGGGIGISFETEWEGRAIRIKPSVEWMFQRDEIRLSFADVESEGVLPENCSPCRAVSTRAQKTKGFHSVGPGIEVDVDAGRMGDFVFSVFTQFHALRVLGGKKTRLDASGSWQTRTVTTVDGQKRVTGIFPAAGRADSTATASYEREAWGYQAVGGVRILWSPE